MTTGRPTVPDIDRLAEGILAGERGQVARAITLVESTRADHAEAAQELLLRLHPHAEGSSRVGISGIPGAGKSTCIDRLGSTLVDDGHKVAVLAVDPSSTKRGGSILGDKTRMASLAAKDNAYIRPSPSAGFLGGVAKATREATIVVEAAGFDVVIIETVGTGQSESMVADMVDTFVLLTMAGTGDSLQGIKRGVLELADVVAVNKAEGDRARDARRAARELADAMHLFADEGRQPQVLTCSGLDGSGLDTLWSTITDHRRSLEDSGELAAKRHRQQREWMWAMVRDRLLDRLRTDQAVKELRPELEGELRDGAVTPTQGADRILEALGLGPGAALTPNAG